jgi:hypothetical protein
MMNHITNVIKEYQAKLRDMPFIPKVSYQRDSLGFRGDANTTFLTFLFSYYATGVQFLKYVGIIRSKVQCNYCGGDDLVRKSHRSWFQVAMSKDGRWNQVFWL